MMSKKASFVLGAQGQALIEFIIFLPFMLMMYTVVVSLGDAIHGSINQQKVTRSYFYFRLQNNSQISKPQRQGDELVNKDWTQFGHFFIGWAEFLRGQEPFAPCYKLNLPFAAAASDRCDQEYRDTTTQFIRVGTVYGICGATFNKGQTDSEYLELPVDSNLDPVLLPSSCLIQ